MDGDGLDLAERTEDATDVNHVLSLGDDDEADAEADEGGTGAGGDGRDLLDAPVEEPNCVCCCACCCRPSRRCGAWFYSKRRGFYLTAASILLDTLFMVQCVHVRAFVGWVRASDCVLLIPILNTLIACRPQPTSKVAFEVLTCVPQSPGVNVISKVGSLGLILI